jgi:hypothetical protein
MAQQSVSAVQNNQNVGMREVMQLLQMLAARVQMLAARGSSSRRQRIDNPYTATAVANAQVNNPTQVRAGTRKSSGGQSSGAKKTELQERAAARKKGRADRRSEFIASNAAKTRERKNKTKFEAANKLADRELKAIEGIAKDVDKMKRSREIQRFREENPLPDKGPLDALALMGQEGRSASVPVNLPANQAYGPQGQTTTQVMGPDAMRAEQDAIRDYVANQPQTQGNSILGGLRGRAGVIAADEHRNNSYNPPGFENSGLGPTPPLTGPGINSTEPYYVRDENGEFTFRPEQMASGSPYNVGSNPIPPPPPPYNPPGFEDSGLYATELNSKGYNRGGFNIQQGPFVPRNYGFTGRPNPLQGVFGPNPYAHYPPVPQPQNPLSNFPPGSFQY